jgi:hypothetical protein
MEEKLKKMAKELIEKRLFSQEPAVLREWFTHGMSPMALVETVRNVSVKLALHLAKSTGRELEDLSEDEVDLVFKATQEAFLHVFDTYKLKVRIYCN